MIERVTGLTAALFLAFAAIAVADDFTDMVEKGNRAFKEGDYKTALDYYHQAEVERPETPELHYNIGSALYGEQKYEEAEEKLQKSFAADDILKEAAGHYNLGNVYYRMGDYQRAILSYQQSLELNPDDMDAKYNLELARKMLKEQIKPEQQQQQQQQQQEQQDQQENQDQEQQQQQEQPQPQDDQEQDQEEQEQQPQQMDENEMSKEDAERILNALKDDEKDLQKQQQRFKGKGTSQGKDW
jgi:Ca-activated chloride channel family protein